MNCKTCKYWVDEKHRLAKNGNQSTDDTRNENAGTCRRYAPSARNNNFRCWPVTVESDFCHDWMAAQTSTQTVSPAVTHAVDTSKVLTESDTPAKPSKPSFFKARKKVS